MADSTRLPSTSGFFLSGQDNGEILNIIHIDCKHRTFPSKLRYRRAWNAGFACDAAWRSELRFGRNHFNMSFSSSAFASRTEEKRQLPGLGWPGSPFLGVSGRSVRSRLTMLAVHVPRHTDEKIC